MQTPKRPSQLTETLAICTRPAPTQIRQGHSTEKGKGTQGPTPNQKTTCNWYWKRENSVFFNGVSLGIWTTLYSRPMPRSGRQSKSNSVGFCCCCLCVHVCVTSFYFVFFWLFFVILLFCLFVFLCFVGFGLLFIFIERDREHKIEWERRWGPFKLGEGKNLIKIYEKISSIQKFLGVCRQRQVKGLTKTLPTGMKGQRKHMFPH